jgi:hypothetical protein
MEAYKTQTDNQSDVQLSLFLQIPQNTPVQLEFKVEPAQYSFYLNKALLQQIEQGRETDCSLYIPPKLLAYLWYYTCFSDNTVSSIKLVIPKKNFNIFDDTFIVNFIKLLWSKSLQNKSQNKSILQYGLTFNFYYKANASPLYFWKDQDIVLQSNIFFYGDIIHKIRSDFIQNPDCLNIVSVHYWLVEQILNSLRTKLNLLAWELASLLPGTFLALKLHFTISLSIVAGLLISFIFATIRYLLVNQISKWTTISSQYRNWLAWGVTCLTSSIFSPRNFLVLLFLSLVGPLLQWFFRFVLGRIGKGFMRWLLS